MVETIETIIIGGGQAGLSLSYYLNQAGREHVVIEKSDRVADAWRNRRWDSFTLITPNWAFRLPGSEYMGSEPDGYMLKNEIVRRFEQFEIKNQFPVRYSTKVTQVEPVEGQYRYRIITNNQIYESKNVVQATGMYQKVKIPAFATQITPDILQIPSDAYRNPRFLPPGAVLVVGSSQSGCQIAEDLNDAGRKVYLSTSSAGRLPRRYRSLDCYEWLRRTGFMDRTVATMSSPRDRVFGSLHCTGKAGGHEINLHKFYRDGIALLGHVRGYEDGKLIIAQDLKENLTAADVAAANIIKMIDGYILNNGIDAPTEEVKILDDGFHAPIVTALDLAAEGVSTVIWATGYSFESLSNLPLVDEYGYPISDRGVTQFPGMYFLGMPWMNKIKSGFLLGIADSAQYLAEVICKE